MRRYALFFILLTLWSCSSSDLLSGWGGGGPDKPPTVDVTGIWKGEAKWYSRPGDYLTLPGGDLLLVSDVTLNLQQREKTIFGFAEVKPCLSQTTITDGDIQSYSTNRDSNVATIVARGANGEFNARDRAGDECRIGADDANEMRCEVTLSNVVASGCPELAYSYMRLHRQ